MTATTMRASTAAGWGFVLTAALFIASGFSSLIYQVVWTRMLVLIFGSTTFATSTVLAVFMGGLAAGSFAAGQVADRIKRPFFWYGVIEAVIGLWALLVPFLFSAAVPLYRLVWQHLHPTMLPFSLTRFAMAAIILIIPTALMGATLPLLSRFVTSSLDIVGKRVGTLYSVNTLGAVAGATLAGFLFLPALGLSKTTILAAVINLLLCATVVSVSPKLERKGREPADQASGEPEPAAVSLSSEEPGVLPGVPATSRQDAGAPAEGETGALPVVPASSRQDAGAPAPTPASTPAPTPASTEPYPAPAPMSWLIRLAVISFGISGAVAMIYEVGWTRTLLMVIGSSTYAFTVMLSTFLVGIFAGSLICARFIDRSKQPIGWFAAFEIGVCLFGLSSMMLFNHLPWWNLRLNALVPHDPLVTLGIRFLLAAMILLPLTLCLGAIFPAIVKACTRELEAVGKSVGTLYSVNTLGAIIGAFAAGFVLVPLFGVERTLVAASAVNLVIGVGLMLLAGNIRPFVKVVSVLVGVPVFLWCFQMSGVWDRELTLTAQAERRYLVQGTIDYTSYDEWLKALHEVTECLFWKDGISSTVGIVRWKDAGHRSLMTNGHVDASDGEDKATQILLAAYPLLWRPDSKDVAVVGWGSGMTLGTASLFPVSEITAIELEPSVIDASKFFHHVNHRPENDPRIHLEINDGRNYLLATDKKFDVIISEPSNPWQAGVCNLFTREYFRICHDRLKPDGVFAFWLQAVEIPPQSLREVMAGLHQVFPVTLALTTDRGNMVVLASEKPLTIDYSRLTAEFANKALVSDLGLVGIGSPEALLARIEAAPDGIARLTAGAPANVDDTNRLEYAVGRTYENRYFMKEDEVMVQANMGLPWRQVIYSGLSDKDIAARMAEVGRQALLRGRNLPALRWAQASLAAAKNAEAFRIAGIALAQEGRSYEAQNMWAEALAVDPANIDTLQTRGTAYLDAGLVEPARRDFRKVLEIEPGNHPAVYHLAQTYSSLRPSELPLMKTRAFFPTAGQDRSPEMVAKYLEPLLSDTKLLERHHDILFYLGAAQFQLGQLPAAEKSLRRFLELEPDSISGLRYLGSVLQGQGRGTEAAALWLHSLNIARGVVWPLRQQAGETMKAGKNELAIHQIGQCLTLWPADGQAYQVLSGWVGKNREADSLVSQLQVLKGVLDRGKSN